MKRTYKFDLTKYFTEEEIGKMAPIIENFVGLFPEENEATLKMREDVTIIVRKNEGAVIHMVLENADRYTALGKTLSKPREFVNKFIIAMAKEIDARKPKIDVEAAKAKLAGEAEDNLLSYIGSDAVATAPLANDSSVSLSQVFVNGKEITDEKAKADAIAEIEKKKAEFKQKLEESCKQIFQNLFGTSAASSDEPCDWIKTFLE